MVKTAKSAAAADLAAFDLKAIAGDLACTHMALRRAARRLGNLYDDAVAGSGLNATQVGLLAHIQAMTADEGPTLQALAQAVAIGLSSLTHALRPLVRDGLLTLNPDANDKRVKHAVLTPLGLERLRTGLALWRAANRRTDAVLGADAALVLRTLADQVSSADFLKTYTAKV